MSSAGYLAIAISIIAALLAVFVFSFIAYRRTPVPQGCEDVIANSEKCEACQQTGCPYYAAIHKKEGK